MLIPLELTVPASIADTGIKNKLFQSGTKTVLFSREKMNDIMRRFRSQEKLVASF